MPRMSNPAGSYQRYHQLRRAPYNIQHPVFLDVASCLRHTGRDGPLSQRSVAHHSHARHSECIPGPTCDSSHAARGATSDRRYMDSNYLSALSPRDMEPQRLRRALLGALRYGKPLVVDLEAADLWPALDGMFARVRPGLLACVTSGRVLREAEYAALIDAADGPEYAVAAFQEDRLARFRFVVATGLRFPDEGLLEAMPVYRVKLDK